MSTTAKRLRIIALPLGDGGFLHYSPEVLLKRLRGKSSDLPAAISKILAGAKVAVGDGILLLHQKKVRVVGLVVRIAGDEIEWLQRAVALPEFLTAVPEYGWQELKDAEVEALFEALEQPPPLPEALTEPAALPALPPTAGGADDPRNVILHGPPGTGKTFTTARRALQLLRVVGVDAMDDATCAKHLRAFQAHDRVAFVTFHQSYGYEEFVEGLRPVLGPTRDLGYEVHKGIFAQMSLRAVEATRRLNSDVPFEELWTALLASFNPPKKVKGEAGEEFTGQAGRNDNLSLASNHGETISAAKAKTAALWRCRSELGATPTFSEVDRVVQREGVGGSNRTALHVAYRELYAVAMSLGVKLIHAPQFVLILDEINRGNISKIFGELITLLEPDKRLGMPHELTLPLAYSPGERFGVPPNLHLLGTMNTADRSIALLDVALRRRFEFEEVMPDPACIPRVLERNGVTDGAFREHVKQVLEVVNARIRFLLDREHQIGHAYLLWVRTYADLRAVFVTKVIPLLQEYFHGAWDRVCIVLGCPYTRPEGPGKPTPARKGHEQKPYAHPMMRANALGEVETIGFDHDEFDDRVEYVVDDTFRTSQDEGVLKGYFDELVAKPS